MKKIAFSSRLTFILKTLLFSYLLTAGLLLLLALFLYRFDLSEKIVSLSITGIYVIATFLSGFLMGKREKSRRFLWGLLCGLFYFLLLTFISVLVNHTFKGIDSGFLTTLILCCSGGMLGGMLS
ncbi:MAG: TIGR04086 family membrane protein [Lachnospiraceae bacterium]|nr:TIGR04086 family membrane protein [Lachnospiraceae bacterium]MBQ9927988.1 TIGR04086 family membrane protein [Lachnospiraceae bacterium]